MPAVSLLSYTPVKGLALVHPDELYVDVHGVDDNRRFYLIAEDGRRYEITRDGRTSVVVPTYSAEAETLSFRFPDGSVAAGRVELDGDVITDFYGRPVSGRVVKGPWADALSSFIGKPLRLVRADRPAGGVDRANGPVSIVSDASVSELARQAGVEEVDGRRFRMLITLSGCRPHEEDEWVGRDVRLGDLVVRVLEQVARCAATTYSPETGTRDLDTLRIIRSYRGVRDGKNLDFGIYGEVVQPGRVAVGDAVDLL
jgi:MOSC domain-containing protein